MKQRINWKYTAVCLLLGMLTACLNDEDVPADVVTNALIPDLSEIRIKEKTATTATLEGEIVEKNGYPVMEKGISWGTSLPLDGNDTCTPMTGEDNTIRLTIQELKASTTYYFRLYATNRAGTGYSSNIGSTTTGDGLGSVRTFIIEDNTKATTAKAGGIIDDRGEGDILERGVFYATSANMANKDSIISTEKKDSFVCDLSGLSPSATYYVQAYVKNKFGIFMGDSKYFTTGSGIPDLSDITKITPESNKASVEAKILSIGDADLIQSGFCWSKYPDIPTAKDNTIIVAMGADGQITGTLQPLESSQRYYVRAFAKNEFGTGYSAPQEFMTRSNLPTLITLDPTKIQDGTAVFGGTVVDVGDSEVIRVGVCYSTTRPEPTIDWDAHVDIIPASPVSGNLPYSFSTGAIAGLRGGGTNYYIRAYAINGDGIQYGEMKILHTPPIFMQETESFTGGSRIEGSSAYFVIGDKGYILGGDIGPTYISNLYCYNPALPSSPRWGELNPYADGAAGNLKWQSVAVLSDRVYVLGGLGSGSVVKNDFYSYYAENNMWTIRPTGPDPAYSRAGFSLNNELIYVGGMKDTANNEVWAYSPPPLNTWSQKTDFPVNQYGGIAVTINNEVFVGLGKNTVEVGNKQLWRSSGTLTAWMPEPVGTELSGNVLAGVAFNNKIYVIDKSPSASGDRYSIFEYNPSAREWKRKSDLPNYSGGWNIQFMYSLGGRIYVGFAGGNRIVSYEPLWDN